MVIKGGWLSVEGVDLETGARETEFRDAAFVESAEPNSLK